MNAADAQRIMDRHARSFAPAARLLSRPDRARIAQLYALCRTVDDLADTGRDPAAAEARLRRIEADLTVPDPQDPVARSAAALFAGRPRGLGAFARLTAGVRSDLRGVRIEHGAALNAYCSAVAGSVGVMVCSLFDIPPQHHRAADALGRAMQLTNICRDVLEDARMGRRYLPATLCPCAPEDILLAREPVAERVRDATALLLDEAEALYGEGMAGLGALPFRLRIAVTLATSLYRGIGWKLHARDSDPLCGRVRLRRGEKVGLALMSLPIALRRPKSSDASGWQHA